MPSHGDPLPIGIATIRNGGQIQTETGVAIISVSEAGLVTVAIEDIDLTGDVVLGSDSADTITINGTTDINAPVTGNSAAAGATGYTFVGYQNSASPAAQDRVFVLRGDGENDNGDRTQYGAVQIGIIDPSDGTEQGGVFLQLPDGADGGLQDSIVAYFDATDMIFSSLPSGVDLLLSSGGGNNDAVVATDQPFAMDSFENIAAGTGGAISVGTAVTTFSTDAGGDAFTLADGRRTGQIKLLKLLTDGGGDGVVTPANFLDGTTLTFANANETAVLIWTAGGWAVVSTTATVG